MDDLLTPRIRELRSAAETVARASIAPRADAIDADCAWPRQGLRALADADLMGLHVPARLGGQEQGLLALAVLTEAIGRACSSTALCYGMHCVGSAVIAAKATRDQEDRYLRPIAEGRHVTTLALSESGTGAHFYIAQTKLRREGSHLLVDGQKQFVTSGSCADSYVLSTLASNPDAAAGEFSCLVVDRDGPGMRWQNPWAGLGMRGNSAMSLRLEGARVPAQNLLGEEGDEIWYVFQVVAPYFLVAMSGTYLGIAQAALDLTLQHLRERRYAHSGEALGESPVPQHRLAEMWTRVEKSRLLIYQAARLGDLGDPQALVSILACKADIADTAVHVTNEAMTLCGGMAYRENSHLARLLRDARAAHVMSPTTDMLKLWAGKALLGLPLL
jgi:alkylation response protein AidB-like acyl-CoA dehydrogenase